MPESAVALLARDGFFFQDGRGWSAAAGGRQHSLDWPFPPTVLGALRSAWGRHLESVSGVRLDKESWPVRTADVRLATMVALRRPLDEPWSASHRSWPAPLDALAIKGEVVRLAPERPTAPTLAADDNDAREALWRPHLDDRQKPEELPRWWNDAAFCAWLAGEQVEVKSVGSSAPHRRLDVHVGIDADTLASRESALFALDVVETIAREGDRFVEWAIGVRVEMPEPAAVMAAPVLIGGEGRTSRVQSLPESVFAPPERLVGAFDVQAPAGLRVVVVTPALFQNGWLPDKFEAVGDEYHGRLQGVAGDLILRAAFVPRPLAMSGWDMAKKQAKPPARLVAPGAVYFFVKADGAAFTSGDARALWLRALGQRTSEGLGCVVPGLWSPRR